MRALFTILLAALTVAFLNGCGSSSDSPNAPLSAAQTSFNASGGQTALSVHVGNKTAWTIHSPATWLTVSSYAGTGTTTLQLTVAENVTPGDRSAEVLLGQQGVRITQSGGNNTVPAVFEKASFRLPSAMTCIAPGQWSSETATTLCELKVASAPGFVDLNSIETGNSGANAAYYKVRKRTFINGTDAYLFETVPDQNGISWGKIWLNHGANWYAFATRTHNADLLYVLTTTLQFSQ